MVTVLLVVVLLAFVALIAYLFGRYWLGYRAFRGHLRTINWSAYAGVPDWWHMGLGFNAYANFDPGFHFTSAGMMLRIGPFTCGWNADDSN